MESQKLSGQFGYAYGQLALLDHEGNPVIAFSSTAQMRGLAQRLLDKAAEVEQTIHQSMNEQ